MNIWFKGPLNPLSSSCDDALQSERALYLMACYILAITGYKKEKCHLRKDWNGCNEDCTLSRVTYVKCINLYHFNHYKTKSKYFYVIYILECRMSVKYPKQPLKLACLNTYFYGCLLKIENLVWQRL